MARRFTTIVCVVAACAGELVTAVAKAATNVSGVVSADIAAPDDDARRRLAWAEAMRRRNVYTLVDFDPLAGLAAAWAARLGGDTNAMDAAEGLVTIGETAEYLLVADDLDGDAVHWYHGFMHGLAPQRVVMIEPHPESILTALAHLRPSPQFPQAETIVRRARDYVPTTLSVDESAPQLLTGA